MIASLRGKIVAKNEKCVVLETGGVGYKVYASIDTLSHLVKNQEFFLYIYTHVREDAFDLYGFLSEEELEFFEMLLSVSGIGPKGALGVLSAGNINTLKNAIGQNDIAYLTRISGIGRKTAERMVIDLREKVGKVATGSALSEELDVLEALRALGYRDADIRETLKKTQAKDTNTKIKEALKILSGK